MPYLKVLFQRSCESEDKMEDYCVVCGAIVPEGLQVCQICEIKYGIRKDNNMEMCILLAGSSVSELQSTAKSEQGKIKFETFN